MVYRDEGNAMTGRTWVVVADSSHANIYLREQRNSPLKAVRTLEDTQAPSPSGESPTNGNASQQAGAVPFARRVCGTLERGRNRGAFDELILIAPPRLLGMMRESLTKPTLGRVSREIAKNLVRYQPERLRSYLKD